MAVDNVFGIDPGVAYAAFAALQARNNPAKTTPVKACPAQPSFWGMQRQLLTEVAGKHPFLAAASAVGLVGFGVLGGVGAGGMIAVGLGLGEVGAAIVPALSGAVGAAYVSSQLVAKGCSP